MNLSKNPLIKLQLRLSSALECYVTDKNIRALNFGTIHSRSKWNCATTNGAKVVKTSSSVAELSRSIHLSRVFLQSVKQWPERINKFSSRQEGKREKKKKKERMRKSTRHICRTVQSGSAGWKSVCFDTFGLPFVLIVYPICLLTRATTPSRRNECYSASRFVYIGRSSDFRCGFVCPQSFAVLHQRRLP